jgi:hypothetical protein
MKTNFEKQFERKFDKGIIFFICGIVVFAGFGAIVMLLWNCLLPAIFKIATINYWQALGILALSKILFGNCGFGKHHHAHKGFHDSLREKWMKMSDEERKEFLMHRRHFCFGHDVNNREDGKAYQSEQ